MRIQLIWVWLFCFASHGVEFVTTERTVSAWRYYTPSLGISAGPFESIERAKQQVAQAKWQDKRCEAPRVLAEGEWSCQKYPTVAFCFGQPHNLNAGYWYRQMRYYSVYAYRYDKAKQRCVSAGYGQADIHKERTIACPSHSVQVGQSCVVDPLALDASQLDNKKITFYPDHEIRAFLKEIYGRQVDNWHINLHVASLLKQMSEDIAHHCKALLFVPSPVPVPVTSFLGLANYLIKGAGKALNTYRKMKSQNLAPYACTKAIGLKYKTEFGLTQL